MTKEKLQFIVALIIIAVWVLGIILSIIDGSTLAKATTPIVMMMFGWLFTQKATTA
jgi:hypothetical protein